MSINEEITALLNGDLDDEVRVAELMHVLAVSPEKRSVLQQQIRMSRAFNTMGNGIVPPRVADQGILAGIAAIDKEFAGHPPGPPSAPMAVATGAAAGIGAGVAAGTAFGWLRTFIMGAVLMGLGLGAGYVIWHTSPETSREPVMAARPAAPVAGETLPDPALRDSLEGAQLRLAALSAEHQEALARIAALQRRPALQRSVRNSGTGTGSVQEAPATREPIHRQTAPPVADDAEEMRNVATVSLRSFSSTPAEGTVAAPSLRDNSEPLDSRSYLDDFASSADTLLGPWHIGMRDHFRLSLPRVYGLAGNRSILFDKEMFLSCKLATDPERSPLSLLRVAVAVGETQFTQVYHDGKAGNLADLIVEQSPTVLYGRMMLSSDVFRTGPLSGSIELGTGGTMIGGSPLGPIGTFGVNMEYRPVDLLALHLGASSWLLWTEYNGQIYTSTNLNGHLGVALGF